MMKTYFSNVFVVALAFDAFCVRGFGSEIGLQAVLLHSPCLLFAIWHSFGVHLVRLGHAKTLRALARLSPFCYIIRGNF